LLGADLVLTGATVYPSPEARPIADAVVVIHDGRIAAAGPRGAAAAELNAQTEAMLNHWGFTTVFDAVSVLENTLALRRRIESGELRGPRILTVGELFTGSLQARGAVANMPVEVLRAAVEAAHRHHLPVFADPQNSVGLEAAIAGGVDILAHTAPQLPPWTPEFVARFKQAHIALIPTLTLFDFEARKGGEPEPKREAWIAKMVAESQAFSAGGGQVLFGTDAGYTDHLDTAMEYDLRSRADMTLPRILAP
jgi:hypothetical protein